MDNQVFATTEAIISIWPMMEVAARALHIPTGQPHSMTNHWVLTPGSIEKPTILRVGIYRSQRFEGSKKNGEARYSYHNIEPAETAADLVRLWSDNKGGGVLQGKPGIFVTELHGNFSVKDLQDSEGFFVAMTQQDVFAKHAVNQARTNYNKNKPHFNTEFHHAMASLLKISGEAWQSFDLTSSQGQIPCPFCTSPCLPAASICKACHQIINPVAFAAMEQKIRGGFVPDHPAIDLATLAAGPATPAS